MRGVRPVHRAAARRSDDYARFRAAVEQHGADRARWSRVGTDGLPADCDPRRVRYHEYAQFLADEQLTGSRPACGRGRSLSLDLPVGTHPAGFDVFADPESFVTGATVGAPPDVFFADGQDWGFRPPHPEGARRNGYRELAACSRTTSAVRRHPPHRPRDGPAPALVGPRRRPRDRGRVRALPGRRAVRRDLPRGRTRPGRRSWARTSARCPTRCDHALDRHALHGMYVAEFAVDGSRRTPLVPPAPRTVASIGTHDTATFAGFWTGTDIDDRIAAGRLGVRAGARERSERARIAHPPRGAAARRAHGRRPRHRRRHRTRRPGRAARVPRAQPRRLRARHARGPVARARPPEHPGSTADQHPSWAARSRPLPRGDGDGPVVEESLARLHRAPEGRA